MTVRCRDARVCKKERLRHSTPPPYTVSVWVWETLRPQAIAKGVCHTAILLLTVRVKRGHSNLRGKKGILPPFPQAILHTCAGQRSARKGRQPAGNTILTPERANTCRRSKADGKITTIYLYHRIEEFTIIEEKFFKICKE